MIPERRRSRLPAAVALAAAVFGSLVAWHYHTLGLTLTHYDARGHLIVARRIADSITPGGQQIGAVWLPLPHLLNALPVQIDFFYRTGMSAVALSIAEYAIAAGAIAWIVLWLTESPLAAVAGTAVFALNPNVLYLQSTPMTEPLLLATTSVAVAMIMAWSRADGAVRLKPDTTPVASHVVSGFSRTPSASIVGWAFALACLTRYEAWPVTISALIAAAWSRWRGGRPLISALRDVSAIAIYPAVAVAGFALFSRAVVGSWFVGSDFFVPENKALGDPMLSLAEIGWGTQQLSGALLTWIGGAGVATAVVIGLISRRRADALTVLALLGMAAIPWTAFLDGHPFRIRYMVPLMAVEAIGAGILAGSIPGRRLRAAAAIALLVLVGYELRPLDASAPMVLEAQWDRPNLTLREAVTSCITQPLHGEKIMASMGSLGHYMQEAAQSGLTIRDFLHEGNGDIWLAALEQPRPFAAWMLIEEKAEGGDMLARRAREHPEFLTGYARVCEGAGLALYRRARPEGRPLPEPDVDGERVRDPAEIDPAAGEILIRGQRAGRRLIAQFTADAPLAERHAHAAEDHRPRRGTAADEIPDEDRVVRREKLPRLAVAVAEYADASADVRLDGVAMPHGEPAHRRGERHDAQFQILLNLGAVRVDEVAVDRRHRPLVIADAESGVEIVAERGDVLRAKQRTGEVADLEREKIEIVDQHIVRRPSVGGPRAEPAKRKGQLLLSGGDWRSDEPEHRQRYYSCCHQTRHTRAPLLEGIAGKVPGPLN